MVTTAITSRGCPHSCPFCLTYKKQYRIRDIDHILDEMEHCLSLGITETHFIDDLFTPNSQWVLKFCDAIERRGLKFSWGYKTTIAGTTREQIRRCRETGCTKIHFGVESANNEGLDAFGKHCDTDDVHRVFKWCREEGVRSVAYIMLAGPHERTMDEALTNLDEMIKLDADFAVFAVYSPYPGTDSFADGAKLGLYAADCWDRMMKDPLCGVEVPVCWEEHLSKAEILELLKISHRRFYMRPHCPPSPWAFDHIRTQTTCLGCSVIAQTGASRLQESDCARLMRHAQWGLCAVLLGISLPVYSDENAKPYEVRLLRVEGAAAGVRRSAERLAEISKEVSSGKLENLPAIHTELTDLHRMVVSARMAVDIAIQDMESSATNKAASALLSRLLLLCQ